MLYQYINTRSPSQAGRLTSKVGLMSESMGTVTAVRALLGQARNEAKGARDANQPDQEKIAKLERLAFNLNLQDRHYRLELARATVDVQHAVKGLFAPQDPDTTDDYDALQEWQRDVIFTDVVAGTEMLLNALAAVAGRRNIQDPLGTSQKEDAQAELREKFYPAAKKLLTSLPELPFWFGRETHEAATHLLAMSLTTAIGAKGVGMYMNVHGIDEAQVTLVVDHLAKAGWGGTRKAAEPHMNYPSFEVFMPPRKAPSFR